MSSSKKESDNMRAIIVKCLEDSGYRNEFGKDPLATIDKHSSTLGCSSNDLSQAQKDFLKSLTADDVENLKRLYDKAEQYGMGEPLRAL